MRFIRMELFNYRPYRGKCEIEFGEAEKRKTFYVIMGQNGTGKTSILNAIHWCLYDEEADRKSGQLLNNSVSAEMHTGDVKEVKVDLYLKDDEEDLIYWLSRRKEYEKAKGGSLLGMGSKLKVSVSKKGGGGFTETWPEMVTSILPEGVKRFFIFNGEELKSFFGLSGPKEVYSAVLDVSQIDLLTKTLSHLGSVTAEEAREISVNPEAESLSRNMEAKAKEIADQEEKIKKERAEIAQSNAKLGELREFLKKSNVEAVRQRQQLREAYGENLEQLLISKDEAEAERAELVLDSLPAVYLSNPLEKVSSTINKLEKEGKIPPNISADYIQTLIKARECICGTDLRAGSKEEKKLKELLGKWASYEEYSQVFIDLRSRISDATSSNSSLTKDLQKIGERIVKSEKNEGEINRKLEALKPTAGETNAEEIVRKEQEEQRLSVAVQTANQLLGADDQELKRLQGEKAKIGAAIDEILEKEAKDKYTKFRVSLYRNAEQLIDSIKDSVLREVREGIEKRTGEYFAKMIWKKDAYKDVEINNDYAISVKDRYGTERVGNMSAGEEQILAFSFMAALKEISGFDAPIVIDTPLGRIAQEQKEMIAESLPNFLEGKQVTLLMTDSEFTPQIRKALESRIAGLYEIVYDQKNDSSVVKKSRL